MRIILPTRYAIDLSSDRLGTVRQLASLPTEITSERIPFTKGRHAGHRLSDDGGRTGPIVFPKAPPADAIADEERALVGDALASDDLLDLREARWVLSQAVSTDAINVGSAAAHARDSWLGAFRFVEEDPDHGKAGLRRPQIGALHAIHAHWSTGREVATVVLPTGVGKTEVMLSTLLSAGCERLLVLVPSDALRTQIAAKFETLGMLPPGSSVLDAAARFPVVGTLRRRPTTPDEVLRFFGRCNVVVATSQLVGRCQTDIQKAIAEWSSHLFIDEAHHAEAPTWKSFRAHFSNSRILQFTATPFREDGKRIEGSLIYTYPLRLAQAEGYFRPIRFHDVAEYDRGLGDQAIANAALDELDHDPTGKHLVMARVAGISRARIVLAIYRNLGRHAAVLVHSDLSARDRAEAMEAIRDGRARVIVCVDMLGEGFDLPELKIAAFHDIRKSLSVTLQLAGRFTRARHDLGDPVFIANTAQLDVRDELQRLYAQDPDWNELLPDLVGAAIEQQAEAQRFFQGFDASPAEVPIKDLRPAASMVVYRTRCPQWIPHSFRNGLPSLNARSRVVSALNQERRTLVVMFAREQALPWTDLESIVDWGWELVIAMWDEEASLLYIHGSDNAGDYKSLAKALCGNDVQLIEGDNVFRCFHQVKRLTLNNVGLNEHLGRNVRYTGRMGADVERRTGIAVRRATVRAVIAGSGFEKGQKMGLGASRKGRVWSHQRLSVDALARWAHIQGHKLADDSISSDDVLAGTIKPVPVAAMPAQRAIAIDWPVRLWEDAMDRAYFIGEGVDEAEMAFVDIEPCYLDNGQLRVRIFGETWESLLALELFPVEDGADFRFVHAGGVDLRVRIGARVEPLSAFLTNDPPTLWYADGASLEGCHYAELPSDGLLPFPLERIDVIDWAGVNIQAESQGEVRRPDTVQHRVIEVLLAEPRNRFVFDDDGSGEVADVVAVRWSDEDPTAPIEVSLYHCKFAGAVQPGGRVDDLYVVCGQAQRSVRWVSSHGAQTGLFTRLLRHEARRLARGRATRFELGDMKTLTLLRDMSRLRKVAVSIYVVQPGLSRQAARQGQLELLAVTERYLQDTYDLPFFVIGSA
jgi:superfamily II DNA or RNA helicase